MQIQRDMSFCNPRERPGSYDQVTDHRSGRNYQVSVYFEHGVHRMPERLDLRYEQIQGLGPEQERETYHPVQ